MYRVDQNIKELKSYLKNILIKTYLIVKLQQKIVAIKTVSQITRL